MKDKRTYNKHKEHGEDISHENEIVIDFNGVKEDKTIEKLRTEALGPRSANRFHMYRGSRILELVERGLELEACSLELDACHLLLSKLGA
jgi:hypothetical protein